MDGFVEKFNIFDLFTMLIPGIIISGLLGITLSFEYYNTWSHLDNEKYAAFFVFSYVCGVVFQELGTMADNLFLNKLLYGGDPKKLFLFPDKYKKVLDSELSYKCALKVREYFIDHLEIKEDIFGKNIDEVENLDHEKQEELASLICNYCIKITEKYNLTSTTDKMLVISEMSRSLFWGCLLTARLNLFMISHYSGARQFYCIEMVILLILSAIFLYRKCRYEKYRLQMLLRTVLLYIKEEKNTK